MGSLTYTLHLSRHGQSQANVDGIIGGDSGLSKAGREYGERLCAFIANAAPEGCPVWTSTLRRTRQTVRPLRQQQPSDGYGADEGSSSPATWGLYPRPGLDEISVGLCDGMTEAEAKAAQPAALAARSRDKLRFRYPKGES